jgi:malonyl-CoA O-methyltransferase
LNPDHPQANEGAAAPLFVDRLAVRRAFDRAAAGYDAHAEIEREIGRRMLERLDYVRIEPRHVIDLGSGTGAALPALRERYPAARVLGVDASAAMLRAGQRQSRQLRWLMPFLKANREARICADAEALPLKSGLAQLVWSNLMLLWCNDPVAVIREMHRVLEVEGLAMFTTFGPDTLKELRASFGDGATHTQRFVDMHDLGDMLVHAGFADPVMDMEIVTLEYESLDRLFADLRASGAGNAMLDRRRSLGGRAAWQRMRAAYETMRRRGKLPATLEVVYGHAWKGQPKKTADGRAVVRFERK